MSTFAPPAASPAVQQPDPTKRVNYTLGMVLGADDFVQEHAWLAGRTEWSVRDMLGYGTACGLKIVSDTDKKGPRVTVSPGVAVSPRGQLIAVKPGQCAYLNDWLAANAASLTDLTASPPANLLRLYVVLAYAECAVDPVPIPGEPCRTESELMANSRISDSFRLDFRRVPPAQAEYESERNFVRWLEHIEITDSGTSFPSLNDFLDTIRAAASPGPLVHFSFSSPVAPPRVHPVDVCEYLRAAFRVWVTEIRPRCHAAWPGGFGCCTQDSNAPESDNNLLLAEVDVPVVRGGSSWVVDDKSPVQIDERWRPFLINLSLLQKYMACAPHQVITGGGGGGTGPSPGNTVAAQAAFGLGSTAGVATAFSRSDHTHGTPLDPVPAHNADTNAHTLGGDLTGSVGHAKVTQMLGIPLQVPTTTDDTSIVTFRSLPSPGRWVLQKPVAAVERPANLPRFLVVAAGRVSAGPTTKAPVYNNLKVAVNAATPGVLTVTFDNYVNPDASGGTTQYVVQVTPEGADPGTQVTVRTFGATGFDLFVTVGTAAASAAQLNKLLLHIAVSQFFA